MRVNFIYYIYFGSEAHGQTDKRPSYIKYGTENPLQTHKRLLHMYIILYTSIFGRWCFSHSFFSCFAASLRYNYVLFFHCIDRMCRKNIKLCVYVYIGQGRTHTHVVFHTGECNWERNRNEERKTQQPKQSRRKKKPTGENSLVWETSYQIYMHVNTFRTYLNRRSGNKMSQLFLLLTIHHSNIILKIQTFTSWTHHRAHSEARRIELVFISCVCNRHFGQCIMDIKLY